MKMRALARSAKQAAMLSGVIGTLVSGIFYLLGYPDFARGLLIGILSGIGYFYLMWQQLRQTLDLEDQKEAVAELRSGWVERSLYTAGVCIVAYFLPGVHFAGVLIGLLALHGVVFIWGVVALAKGEG
jgi:hypothetical protein